MPKTKFLFKFFPVLLITCNLWAVPFNVEVVKEGSGDSIRAGQLIQVHYKGFLLADLKDSSKVADTTAAAKAKPAAKDSAATDSTAEEPTGPRPFADSYEAGQPLEFTIGMGQVIAGWDKGLIGMKVGEVRKLTVPFQMAYGENSLEGIPPYSDLYFEVELVHAEKPMEPDKFPASVDNLKWKEAAKGLKVYDEKVGTGKPAAPGAILKTHYTGWLLNGRKFGSSRDLGKPLSVVMGAGKMIKGWEQGLEGMREGGVRWFRIAPSMGYGATAYAMIPSNSTLLFRVELVSSEVDEELAAKMDFFPELRPYPEETSDQPLATSN